MSDAWSIYQDRLAAHGDSIREAAKRREIRFLNLKTPRSLSYFTAVIDGSEQQVSILSSDNLDEKTILSMPGETIACGAMVEWADNHWIVTERTPPQSCIPSARWNSATICCGGSTRTP